MVLSPRRQVPVAWYSRDMTGVRMLPISNLRIGSSNLVGRLNGEVEVKQK